MRNDEAGVLEMTVKNLSPEDTANYTCLAENEAGDHKMNGTLIVHCKYYFCSCDSVHSMLSVNVVAPPVLYLY